MAKLPLKTIPLSSLAVGMHIAKLDIPWIKSPFLTHSRRVKSVKDIHYLKLAGVNTVVIDPNKGKHASEVKPQAPKDASHTGPTNETPPSDTRVTPPPAPTITPVKSAEEKALTLAQDIVDAKKVRDQVRKAINHALNQLAAGNSVDREALTPLIDKTLESLEKNNQALLNIVHTHSRTQKLADHTFSTFCLALDLARNKKTRNKKISHEEIESLGIAALLHEAGWAHIPLHLMGKRTPYTDTERKLIEKHTALALRAVAQCDVPPLARRIIAEHHELCNGTGYPRRLTGDHIHPLSKLFAVVDHYDEGVHRLSDQNGLTPTSVLRKLYLEAEKNLYDTDAVGQLIALLGVYPISSQVTLSDGSVGIVREVPAATPLEPLIEVCIDAYGKVLSTPFHRDLTQVNNKESVLRIARVVDLSTLPQAHQQRLQFHA